jgi:hypothetical protein
MDTHEVTWLALMPAKGKAEETLVLKRIRAFVSTHTPCTATLDYIAGGHKRLMGTFDVTIKDGKLVLRLDADQQCYELRQRGHKLYIVQL